VENLIIVSLKSDFQEGFYGFTVLHSGKNQFIKLFLTHECVCGDHGLGNLTVNSVF